MLRFYWGLGRDISLLSKEADYGSNFYKTISGDLKDVFPDIKSLLSDKSQIYALFL